MSLKSPLTVDWLGIDAFTGMHGPFGRAMHDQVKGTGPLVVWFPL
jgi:hypothetical protein